MSSKTKWVAVMATLTMGAVELAGAGFWNAGSQRYWRNYTQSALFFVAGALPQNQLTRKPTELLAKAALRVRLNSVSGIELEKAATLLERAGQPREAAILWLGLANLDASKGDSDAARSHAERSVQAALTEDGLVALIVLNEHQHDLQTRWVRQLQASFPGHELSRARACSDQVRSFSVDPPAACGDVVWVRELAWRGRREEIRITREIAELPQRTALEIAKCEAEIRERSAEQPGYMSSLGELSQQKGNLGWRTAGRIFVDWLPLPQQNDTLETFVTREGLCSMPHLRWACRAGSVVSEIDRMNKDKAYIDDRMQNLSELYRLNESLMGYAREEIDYWKSAKPLEVLVNERSRLLENFRNGLAEEVSRRYPEPGVRPSVAIRTVLALPAA